MMTPRPNRCAAGASARNRARVALLALVVLPTGCAGGRRVFFEPATSELVWPAAPERPRVRFLGQFAGALSPRSTRGAGRALDEMLHGPASLPSLITPHAAAMHGSGTLLAVADPNARAVHLLDLSGESYVRIDFATADPEVPGFPVGVAWAGDVLYAADAARHVVSSFAVPSRPFSTKSTARRVSDFGGDVLQRPASLAYCATVDRLYVADAGAHAVQVFDRDGAHVATIGTRGGNAGALNFPAQVACDPDGGVYVADALNFRVQRFSADGTWLGMFGRKGDAAGDFALPKGVAVDASGLIWVVDAQFENVQAFTPEGQLLLAFGGEGHSPGQFWLPAGITIDAHQRMWIADSYNRRVQAFELLP